MGMKKKTLDIIILRWILRAIKDHLNEALIWCLVVLVIYVFVKPNSILLSINSETSQDIPEQITEVKTFYKTYPKILVFIYHYQNRGRGKLLAIDTEKSLIEGEWNALAGNGEETTELNSKAIPPNKNVDLDHYSVRPQAIRFQSVEIDGHYYSISPMSFYIEGIKYGDFAIYPNHNVPGTLGDIKLETDNEWLSFQELMQEYEDAGLVTIPLLISD